MFSIRNQWIAVCLIQWSMVGKADDKWQSIAIQSTPQVVAPMTGIVLWDDNEKNATDAIQLEYSYVGYDQVVTKKGVYNWQTVDAKLTAIAARGHQAVLRFYFDYVGKPTTGVALGNGAATGQASANEEGDAQKKSSFQQMELSLK